MDNSPKIEDIVRGAILSELDTRWTAELGRVLKYDGAKRIAQIQILPRNRYVDEDGDVAVETVAPLPWVPVVRIAGGPFRLSMPVAEGDEGLIVFCGSPVGSWSVVGGDYDAGFVGKVHHTEGAIFLPGVAATQANDEIVDNDAAVLGSANGAKVRVSESEVQLGDPTTAESVLTTTDATVFMTALGAAISALSSAADPSVTALQALQTALAAWGAGSSTVKASR